MSKRLIGAVLMLEKCFLPKITVYLWTFRTVLIFSAIAFFFIWQNCHLAAIFSAVLAGIIILYLLLFFKRYEITFLKDFLILKYGVIFSTTRILPLNKIIYVNIIKTPILKALGLNILLIKTINGVLILPETDFKTAQKIRLKIEEKNI